VLAGGGEFRSGALRKAVRSHLGEHVIGRAELSAGVESSVFSAQPLPVEEVGPGLSQSAPALNEVVDCLLVERFGVAVVG
jgi:hypothetical protein